MKQTIQQMNRRERCDTLKALKSESKGYRSYVRIVQFFHMVLFIIFAFIGFELVDDLHILAQVAIMFAGITLLDFLVNRLFIYPKANRELQKSDLSATTPNF